ncbi:MAG TPA: UTP--glucose-1-phosphate uridylyltransferase [Chlamydiales bacterium]|nr:UTP--glucose-1-phosphate uridylyltransferase [Chlamydiales bacterium]
MRKTLPILSEKLRIAPSLSEKIALLDSFPRVQKYLQKTPKLSALLKAMSPEMQSVAKQLIAIGQMDRLVGTEPIEIKALSVLLQKMAAVDSFYKEIGGIVGYQAKILEFLKRRSCGKQPNIVAFHAPDFIDISEETELVLEAIYLGLKFLPEIAEMYPLAGAADRLHLVDAETGGELPAAKLNYSGRTLFEGLIRDLQAREFLYFKIFGKQIEVPLAIMTSEEKENHRHVLEICNEYKWFGRNKESFRFFMQPLVPAVNHDGDWHLLGPFYPLLKPGGHGAIWKLARDEGVFLWLEELSRKKALIRQINNPIAGLDYGLLAFSGLGMKTQGAFGFASCSRLLQAAEGVNVVIEKKNGDVVLTNIEYCDFAKYGIEDRPLKEGEPYSQFSSNTNILFVDLKSVENAVQECPFPGLLINLKNANFEMLSGEKKQGLLARLESTMQNIADVFVEKEKTNKTFVTYNHRHKTISTAKKAYIPGGPVQETPEECFYVQLQSARKLLAGLCQFHLPSPRSLLEYLQQGPDILFLYHPALGPLYSLIAQKVFKGSLSLGAEMQLELADAKITNLHLEGSLVVWADQPLGHFDKKGMLRFSHQTGRCMLHNVKVKNRGVDWAMSAPFWKNRMTRFESLKIHLNGFSEFVAENVVFEGNFHFDVPDGMRMKVKMEKGKLVIVEEKLEIASFWRYQWRASKGIVLSKKEQPGSSVFLRN